MNEMRKTKLKNLGYSGGGPAKKEKTKNASDYPDQKKKPV